MLYLDGKSDGWQTFSLNHQKAIVETLLMVTSTFYYSKSIPVVFWLKHGWFSFTSPKISCFEKKFGENPWFHAKLNGIPISWHTWLESCWSPTNFGTRVVWGWDIFLAARIFSTLRVMVVTQILESLSITLTITWSRSSRFWFSYL